MPNIKQIINLSPAQKELLLLADPDWGMIAKYLEKSDIFVLEENGETLCIAAVMPLNGIEAELKNLATRPGMQKKGLARQTVSYLFDFYKNKFKKIYVGTAQQGVEFYKKLGFAPSHTIKNFFIDNYPAPIYDSGEQCVDMVYLVKKTI